MKKNFEYFYDFGKVTASNQYNKNKKKNINFKLIRNKFDGTLKFKNKIEFSKIKPTDKIFFNEPDFHLETLASYLKDLTFNKVVGMTYKDFPLVDLVIGKKNFSNKFKISISKMLNLNLKESPETVLEKFTKCTSKLEKKEKSLIIFRHIWEHVFDHKNLLKKTFNHFSKESIFLIEVPCSEYQIKNLDYTMLWEEHVYYFNKKGFINTLTDAKMRVKKFFKFKNFHEDILCAVCVYDESLKSKNIKSRKMVNFTSRYKNKFLEIKKNTKSSFFKKFKEGLVCYGASHMLNTFVNIFELEKFITLVIDDNPAKNNKFMFINKVKIKNFSYLKKNLKRNCLFFVNTDNSKSLKTKINFLKKNNINVSSIYATK